jgi:hypothetical protein
MANCKNSKCPKDYVLFDGSWTKVKSSSVKNYKRHLNVTSLFQSMLSYVGLNCPDCFKEHLLIAPGHFRKFKLGEPANGLHLNQLLREILQECEALATPCCDYTSPLIEEVFENVNYIDSDGSLQTLVTGVYTGLNNATLEADIIAAFNAKGLTPPTFNSVISGADITLNIICSSLKLHSVSGVNGVVLFTESNCVNEYEFCNIPCVDDYIIIPGHYVSFKKGRKQKGLHLNRVIRDHIRTCGLDCFNCFEPNCSDVIASATLCTAGQNSDLSSCLTGQTICLLAAHDIENGGTGAPSVVTGGGVWQVTAATTPLIYNGNPYNVGDTLPDSNPCITFDDCGTFELTYTISNCVIVDINQATVANMTLNVQETIVDLQYNDPCDYVYTAVNPTDGSNTWRHLAVADSINSDSSVRMIVTETCGATVTQVSNNVLNTPIKWGTTRYTNNNTNRLANGGWIETIRIHRDNGLGVITFIDVPLEAAAVILAGYDAGVITADLIWNTPSSPAEDLAMATAIKQVIENAININWGLTNTSYGLTTTITTVGTNANFVIEFDIKHDPTADWVGIDITDLDIVWHRFPGAPRGVTHLANTKAGNSVTLTENYTTACGQVLGVQASNFNIINNRAFAETTNFNFVDVNLLNSINVTNDGGNVLNGTCNNIQLEATICPGAGCTTTTYTWSGPNGFTSTSNPVIVSDYGDYTVSVDCDGIVCETTTDVEPCLCETPSVQTVFQDAAMQMNTISTLVDKQVTSGTVTSAKDITYSFSQNMVVLSSGTIVGGVTNTGLIQYSLISVPAFVANVPMILTTSYTSDNGHTTSSQLLVIKDNANVYLTRALATDGFNISAGVCPNPSSLIHDLQSTSNNDNAYTGPAITLIGDGSSWLNQTTLVNSPGSPLYFTEPDNYNAIYTRSFDIGGMTYVITVETELTIIC